MSIYDHDNNDLTKKIKSKRRTFPVDFGRLHPKFPATNRGYNQRLEMH